MMNRRKPIWVIRMARRTNTTGLKAWQISLPVVMLLQALMAIAAPSVETVTVTRVILPRFRAATAQVVSLKQAELVAQTGGQVRQVFVKLGDHVQKDQPLVKIESPQSQAAATAAQADAKVAQLMAGNADSDWQRAQRLHAAGYLSDAAYERANAQHEAAKARKVSADANAEANAAIANWQWVKAPYAGEITSLNVLEGEVLSAGQVIGSLYANATLRVTTDLPAGAAADVDTRELVRISPLNSHCDGLPVDTKSWAIATAIDLKSQSVALRVELPKSVHCAPGSTVQVSVPLKQSQAQTWIPMSALTERGELTGVYVMTETGRTVLRQVRVGATQNDQIEILSGLEEHERVVKNAVRFRPSLNDSRR